MPPARSCTLVLNRASTALDILQAYWIGAWGDESLWVVPGFSYTGVISAVLAQALDVLFVVLLLARLATTHRKTGEPRVGAIGLVVESALLYGAVSVVWLGTFSAQSVVANAVLPMYVQLQVSRSLWFFPDASLMDDLLGYHGRPLRWGSLEYHYIGGDAKLELAMTAGKAV